MAFKMRSGNLTTFKMMGSSPNKQKLDNTQIGTTLETYTHHPTEVNVPTVDPIQGGGGPPVSTGTPESLSTPGPLDFKTPTGLSPGDINYPDSSEESKKKKKKEKEKKKEKGVKKVEQEKPITLEKRHPERIGETPSTDLPPQPPPPSSVIEKTGGEVKPKTKTTDDGYIPQSTFGPGENPNIGRAEGDYSHEARSMVPETQKGKKVKTGNGDSKKSDSKNGKGGNGKGGNGKSGNNKGGKNKGGGKGKGLDLSKALAGLTGGGGRPK